MWSTSDKALGLTFWTLDFAAMVYMSAWFSFLSTTSTEDAAAAAENETGADRTGASMETTDGDVASEKQDLDDVIEESSA